MDGDSTNILVISGGRVDELEGDGCWVGHGSGADEITGGERGERGEVEGGFSTNGRENLKEMQK